MFNQNFKQFFPMLIEDLRDCHLLSLNNFTTHHSSMKILRNFEIEKKRRSLE